MQDALECAREEEKDRSRHRAEEENNWPHWSCVQLKTRVDYIPAPVSV